MGVGLGMSPRVGQLCVRTRCELRIGCASGAASARGAPSSRCALGYASGLRVEFAAYCECAF
eukprot:12800821-Alexandrium_andersonii.AAC.1